MKHLYRLVVSLLLFVGFQSCVDEDGAGVPSPKSLIIEADEYTLDMTDLTTPQFIAFRWVDVGNATYTVAFTKASDSDTENIVTEVLNNEVTVEEELNVLSMTISKVQLKDYLTKAGFTQTGTYVVHHRDGREWDSVKGIGFYHRINRHIFKIQSVTDPDLGIEGIFADYVARQAGIAGKAVGIRLFPGQSAAFERRAVRHLKHIRHMAGGGSVKN